MNKADNISMCSFKKNYNVKPLNCENNYERQSEKKINLEFVKIKLVDFVSMRICKIKKTATKNYFSFGFWGICLRPGESQVNLET